jgi:hypothetical protein
MICLRIKYRDLKCVRERERKSKRFVVMLVTPRQTSNDGMPSGIFMEQNTTISAVHGATISYKGKILSWRD